jgi:hypothetical protein
MKRQLDARWLREMAEEVAQAPSQELNWDRIEQGVFDRLDARGPRLLPRPSVAAWPRVLGAAAVAAVAAGLVLTASRSPSTPLDPTVAPVALQQDDVPQGEGMELPTELVAKDHPVTFEHAGWARFRLSHPGRLRVLRMDDRVALHLLEGKVEADVTRQNIDEAVTVRAGNLRVAVHGTLFSVELREGTLRVQVERGSVAVGPASRGATEGWLVTGPSTGVFDLARSRRLHGFPSVSDPISLVPPPAPTTASASPKVETEVEPTSDPKAPSLSPAPVAPRAPIAPSLPEALPEVLTADLAAATLRSITQGVTACHRNAVPSTDGVTIRAQTRISIRVAPDGHVVFARFDPPLSPRAQTCASGVVQGATFPRARVESVLELPLRL